MIEKDKIKAHEHDRENWRNMYDEHYIQNLDTDQYDSSHYNAHQSF